MGLHEEIALERAHLAVLKGEIDMAWERRQYALHRRLCEERADSQHHIARLERERVNREED